MKKLVILTVILSVLLLTACAPKESSPEDKATFCQNLETSKQSLTAFLTLDQTASEEEIKAAYEQAATDFHTLEQSGNKLSEPEVDEFFDAASKLNSALKYADSTVPSGTNYMQMMASVSQEAEAFKASYEAVNEAVCTMP
jgi:outer membrane murein-binding lipoprotein Lpp